MGKEEAELFLKGECNYENFYLKEYISREVFDELVKDEIIKSNPPTTYAIIKKCSCYWQKDISKRKVMSLLSIIRQYRNDIVHGNDIKINLRKVCEDGINAFETLISLLN